MTRYLAAHLLLTSVIPVTMLLFPALLSHLVQVPIGLSSVSSLLITVSSCLKPAGSSDKSCIWNPQPVWRDPLTSGSHAQLLFLNLCSASLPGFASHAASTPINTCCYSCSSCPSVPSVPPSAGLGLEIQERSTSSF